MKFFKGILIVVFTIIVNLWAAFVLVEMWKWFVVATFHIVEINIWQAWGLALLVDHVSLKIVSTKDETEYADTLWLLFFHSLLIIIVGFIIHKFLM